jgi:folate-binding protein YgfZ
MPTALLDDRAILTVTGEDAEHFLQNILTVDLDALELGVAKPGALLTPQGKILFDFLISRRDGGFDLECRAAIADDFLLRLMMYRLRAKVAIAKQDQGLVAVGWGHDSSAPDAGSGDAGTTVTRLRDARFMDEPVERIYGGASNAASAAEWNAFRIASGVPESGDDYALGDAFPHDVLLDQNGGVGFRKGCYVGQEVVSRMQHRGTARRRFLIAGGKTALPAPGTEITAGGRTIGAMGSVSGMKGLALVRIDKVKGALDEGVPILAGDVELSLSIPGWAGFAYPETAASGDDA